MFSVAPQLIKREFRNANTVYNPSLLFLSIFNQGLQILYSFVIILFRAILQSWIIAN